MVRRLSALTSYLLLIALAGGSMPSTTGYTAASQQAGRGVKVNSSPNPPDWPELGNYYALVVGINNYQSLDRLKTAEADAKAVGALLTEQYGFETKVLLEADRHQIMAALIDYRRRLGPNDNLLIYYAGHGYHDKVVDKAYWLPVDAEEDEISKWISADDITTSIKGIPAKHILIISDSCYSGMIYRKPALDLSASVPRDRDSLIRKLLKRKSRQLLSSGSDEPVADGGGGSHSVFANALLRGLERTERNLFTAHELFVEFIQESVAGRSEQLPQFSPLFNSGHDGGEFVFARRRAPPSVPALFAVSSSSIQEAVPPGESFAQRVSVSNRGSAPAHSTRADFVFSPNFELLSATPAPASYEHSTRTAVWSLGDLESRGSLEITMSVRAVPEVLAGANKTVGRGTIRSHGPFTPSNFDGVTVSVGRVAGARVEAVSKGLTATPGDTMYVPFIVRNPSNYPESFELRIVAPGAPQATVYADLNGDGRHQTNEPAVTQTAALDPRGGQYPVLLAVDIPRSAADRTQFAYNLVTRAMNVSGRIAGEDSTLLTVTAPRVRARMECYPTGLPPAPESTQKESRRKAEEPTQLEQETFNRGRALFAKAQYEQAAAVLRDFLKEHPDSFIADLMLLWLGRSYIELGKFQEADEVLQRIRAIKDTPFEDIFDTELQSARAEAASHTTAPTATPTPTEAAKTTPPSSAELSVRGDGMPSRPRATATVRPRHSFITEYMLFYRLTVVNDGSGIAKSLEVVYQLPESLEVVSSTDELSLQTLPGGVRGFVWHVPELAPGETKGEVAAMRLRPNVPADTAITSHGMLTYQDSNSNSYMGGVEDESVRVLNYSIKIFPASSPPNRLEELSIKTPRATSRGSVITIKSDGMLAGYAAYQIGDMYFIEIPYAKAGAMPRVSGGRGFSDLSMEQRGRDVLISCRAQPGVKARVEQQAGRLDIVFELPAN